MARYPAAEWRPVSGHLAEPKIVPRMLILHTMVGTLPGTDSWFNSTPYESHFGVGIDGTVLQWQDTERQADANYHANDFAVSIETEDLGDPDRPWTAAQLDAIADLSAWVCDTHAIPRRKPQSWDGSGVGWHAMWGAPSHWTPVRGKTCPGAVRIRQIEDVLLPRLQEDDMPLTDDDLDRIARRLFEQPLIHADDVSVLKALDRTYRAGQQTLAGVNSLLGRDSNVDTGQLASDIAGLLDDDLAAAVLDALRDRLAG